MTISSDKEYGSLAEAIAQIGSEIRTIEISDIHVVNASLPIPANVTLSFILKGQLNIANGTSLDRLTQKLFATTVVNARR
jgi:hypothetical protein